MKTVLTSLVILLLFPLTVALAQPKIDAVGGTTLDFGDVFKGKKADRVLEIKNNGTDTLKISEVRAQCGCTATMMSETDRNLSPGSTGKVSISFDTHNYDGKVSKQVYVSSNDPTTPKMTITFTTNVLTILDLEPKILSFDNMKVDSAVTKTLTISNPSPKVPIKILSVKPNIDNLKVSLMKTELMPGEKTQLQAVFTPTKSGTFQGTIELATSSSDQPKFEVRYFAWVNRK